MDSDLGMFPSRVDGVLIEASKKGRARLGLGLVLDLDLVRIREVHGEELDRMIWSFAMFIDGIEVTLRKRDPMHFRYGMIPLPRGIDREVRMIFREE